MARMPKFVVYIVAVTVLNNAVGHVSPGLEGVCVSSAVVVWVSTVVNNAAIDDVAIAEDTEGVGVVYICSCALENEVVASLFVESGCFVTVRPCIRNRVNSAVFQDVVATGHFECGRTIAVQRGHAALESVKSAVIASESYWPANCHRA